MSDDPAAAAGSANLLRAYLRYGLRHNRDLGLGAERFVALCRAQGVAVGDAA